MDFIYRHKKGIIGSVIFHLIVLVLLLWLGFFTPLPLPGEEGILVNFGDSENGLGMEEPAPRQNIPPPANETREEETAPPLATAPKAQPQTQPEEKEKTLTQDYEESAAIEAAKKKKTEDDRIKRENAEKERKRLEEIERQKQAELEKQRLAEIERKKKEEEERKKAEINLRIKGALERSGTGSGGAGTGTGQSQGVTFPGGGNQGVATGDLNASTYGPGGSGSGTQGTGISYSLSGRSARSLPEPNYPGNEDGTVVVQVTVDKYGNVTKAEAGFRGSNSLNPELLAAAQKAALQAKFNLDNNAPAFQVGTITYKFSLK